MREEILENPKQGNEEEESIPAMSVSRLHP